MSADTPTTDVPVPTPPPARTFVQADLDRVSAESRDRGARSATNQLLADLGYTSVDEARSALAEARTAREAQMTEQQRAVAEATAAKSAAEQQVAALTAQQHALRIERALLVAGISPVLPDGTPNPAIGYAAKLVDVDPAADENVISAAVTAVRSAVPAWFVPAAPPVPGSDPGRGPLPSQQPGAGTSLEEMRAIAARVHGTTGVAS